MYSALSNKHYALRNFIIRTPFFRLLLSLSAGIVTGNYIQIPISVSFSILILTLGTAIGLIAATKIFENFKFRCVFGILIYIFLFDLGILIYTQHVNKVKNRLLQKNALVELIGTISETPEPRTKTVKCYLDIDQLKTDGHIRNITGETMVCFHKDSLSLKLMRGDIVLIRYINSDVNRFSSDFQLNEHKYRFYDSKPVISIVDSNNWIILAHNNFSILQKCGEYFRQRFIRLFNNSGLTNEETNLASSLILGDASGGDKTINRSYHISGLIHFLSVSGMSVGLIFAILMYVILNNNVKFANVLKSLLILACIWIFTFITGLSEPVVRVSFILTIIIIGKLTNRSFNIIHSIIFSVFLLLLINPGNLYDLGFQLAILSILSIVILYPYILNIFHFDNILPEGIWIIFAATIAIQTSIFPLIIYYFNEFQNLFLLSNILLIPLSAIVYSFAIIMLITSGSYWAGFIFGKIFHFFVWLLMTTDCIIGKIPFAFTNNIFYSGLMVFFIYLIICFSLLFLIRKRPKYLILLLGSILLMSGDILTNKIISIL